MRIGNQKEKMLTKISQTTRDNIITMYEEGMKISKIAYLYDYSWATVNNIVKRNDKTSIPQWVLNIITTHSVEDMKNSGMSVKQISRLCGIPYHWLLEYFHQQEIEITRGYKQQYKLDQNDIDAIVARYLAGESSVGIGKQYNITPRIVLKYVRLAGHDVRRPGPAVL